MTPFHDGQEPTLVLEPEPRPVKDDQACQSCRHPRWMHGGQGEGLCHFTNYGGNAKNRCLCQNFIEPF